MKKTMSMLLALILVFSLCCPAYAASDTAKNNALASAVQDIVTREHGDMVVASRADWLPLEDVSGTAYAYFIPLKSGDSINGYSVISHVGSSNKILKTASGPVSSDLASAIIRTAADNDVARIIYEFPNAFLAEKNSSYYKICTSGALELVNAEDYNKTNAAYFTSASAASQNQTREEITYGELDDRTVGSFIPIPASNGGYYYGGYQGWLTEQGVSQFYANRSCGVTAAANMMYYIFLCTCNFNNEQEIKQVLGPAMFSRIGCCIEYSELSTEQKKIIINKWYEEVVSSLQDDEKDIIRGTDILDWFQDNAERYDNIRILKTKLENAIFDKLAEVFILHPANK